MLDVDLARSFFPPLDSGLVYFENAGRSFVASTVTRRQRDFMDSCPVQPAWPHRLASRSRELVDGGCDAAADLMHADAIEVSLGHSSSMLLYVLAQALRSWLAPGDVVVVTNQDHEANGGVWRRLAIEGIEIREWRVDERGELRIEALLPLLEGARLVCFPHVSNIVGSINDVAEITRLSHEAGARVCVDGVAFAPHRQVDVRTWNVDAYVFSLYKVYGPHAGALYVRREWLEQLTHQGHYFHEALLEKRLSPGGLQYETVAAIRGISEYLSVLGDEPGALFEDIATHEEVVAEPVLAFLRGRADIRLLGEPSADKRLRVPTISFVPAGTRPIVLAQALASDDIAIGAGHFYAPRCLEGIGIAPEHGIARISMVHYNDLDEVDRLLTGLRAALG